MKIKCPTELRDYRPISILCSVSNVLECIAAEQIKRYLESFSLLDVYQFAYRKDYSTQTTLLRVMDDIKHAANTKKIIIAVFFDFIKAFDITSYHTLIHKLINNNFFFYSALDLCLPCE